MIEPLQYNKELNPAYEVMRPVFCHGCLSQKNTKHDPNIAVKFCANCPTTPGQDKEWGAYLCKECDDRNHKSGLSKSHVRQLMVTGPGVRKKVVIRGDGLNFPLPLDHVAIKVKSRIYQNGKCVHKVPWKEMSFVSGMSGRCLHVQVLGARNLKVGDVHGSSDPFVVYSFCGKPLGTTRVRPRSTNPRWDNETFIVPMDDSLPAPREMAQSQKDLVRLEVYDHDWVTQNEFLGHVEITRSKLMKIAAISNQLPIRLPLTMKEYHGFINFQFGYDTSHLHIKAVRAENLNSMDARNLSNPYVKIYLGNSYLVGTSSTVTKSINPQWDGTNVFKIKLLQLLFAERYALSQIDAYNETQERLARINKDTSRQYQSGSASQMMDEFSHLPTKLALFRIEIYHDSRWRAHKLLGKAYISVHKLRKMLPMLPTADIANMVGYSDYVTTTVRQDQFSAKMEALKSKKETMWEKLTGTPSEKDKLRPTSPLARPTSPAVGAASSGVSSGSASTPASAVRRRGNILGAASAAGPAVIELPTIAVQTQPAVTFGDAGLGFSERNPIRNDPPSEKLTLPVPQTTPQYDVLGNLLLPPRPRKPLEISTGFGSFKDTAGLASVATPSALSVSIPNTPGGMSPMAPGGYAPLPQNVSFKSNRSESQASAGNSTRTSPRPEVNTPTAATPLLPESSPRVAPEEEIPPQVEPELAHERGSLPIPTPIITTHGSVHSMNSFMLQRSARPAPPPVSEISERSKLSASVVSKAPAASITSKAEEDHTDDPLLAQDNTASSGRAPFFADHSGSTMRDNTSQRGRSKSLSRISMSFRAAPEITWSDSHPFPVMLDLNAHRGVDAMGNPVSQGFIVLRLIPATRGSVIVGLDDAVRQMTLGETANVKCRYDYAYGAFSMGSRIPPRANVVFKVNLLEINHKGRWDVVWRLVVRFFRMFWRLWIAFTYYIRGEEDPALRGKSSKKIKKQMSFSQKVLQRLGLSSRTNAFGSDSESDQSEHSDSDSSEGEGMAGGEGYGDDEGESEDGGSSVDSFQQYSTRPRVKPDPRMRKHLNQSVHSGAQIMWNFKPPPKVVKKAKTVPKKTEPVQLEPVAENEHDEAHAGHDNGDDSNSDGERNSPGRDASRRSAGAHGIGFSGEYSGQYSEAGEYDGFGDIDEFDLQRTEMDHTHGSDDEEEDG